MKKKVLLTGGAGFIGSHLAEHLLKEGVWDLTIIDDLNDFYTPDIKVANLELIRNSGDFEFIHADICNKYVVNEMFAAKKFDTVVHLAARAGVRPSLLDPALYYESNIIGTLNLLEAARRNGVEHFVFGSSSSVYGINSKVPFSESDKINSPISPYAATKAGGEHMCHTYSHLYGIRTVCLRFFTVYGARQRPDLAIHKFSKLIAQGKPIQVFGDGTSRRDYTYIDDIIQGIRAAMSYDQEIYDVFNLGESETTPLSQLIDLLETHLGVRAVIERQPPQMGDVPITYANICKAKDLLGYAPKTKIDVGIPKFVEWFKGS